MQKKLIALAIAGLSGAAFAQSNVTIYGVVDAYMVSGKGNAAAGNTTDKFTGVNAGGLSGSRLGFKAVEGIGNGLSAVTVLEFGTLDTTANAVTSGATQSTTTNGMDTWRQAFVGLTGGFGTAVAGRLQTPGYDFAAKYDALGASIFSPVGQLSDNNGMTITARGATGRLDNAVAYISPAMGGVTVKAAYAFGEQVKGQGAFDTAGVAVVGGDYKDPQTALSLSADYDAGPLSAGIVYQDIKHFAGTTDTGNNTNQKEWGLAAKYNFGMVTPFVSWQQRKATVSTGASNKDKLWNLGASVAVSANGAVKVAYGRLTGEDSAGTTGLKANSIGIDYEHSLSKRTTAYIGYSQINNDAGRAYTLKNLKGSAAGQTVATGADQKATQYAVGLRHTF